MRCLCWARVGSGPGTSCHEHFLKPQAHSLPTLEFHTLPANSSQEGDSQAWFFIFTDSCHQQRGCPDQPEPGGQRRRSSVHPLLKYHLARATHTSATPPSCLGGCPRHGTCVGRGKEMVQILPLAIKISLVWGGFPSSRSGAAKNRVRCSCTV